MDLYPQEKEESTSNSQENLYQFSKDNSIGFSTELMISQDQIRKISESKLDLKKEKIFRMPSSLAYAMKKAFSRKNEIVYCISSKEISVDISEASGKVYLPLLNRNEVKQNLLIPIFTRPDSCCGRIFFVALTTCLGLTFSSFKYDKGL